MLIDAEPSADPPQLRAIVDSQVQQKTKSLQRELDTLKSQLRLLTPKNNTRGPRTSGASQKKKKAAPIAAAAENGTTGDSSSKPSRGNRQRSNKNSTKRSNRKKQGSRTTKRSD